MKTLIIDASIGAKLFIQEDDSQQAIDLFEASVRHSLSLVVPELFKYEITSIAHRLHVPLEPVLRFFDDQVDKLLSYQKPSMSAWLKAEEIAKKGHKKSGYPSMYDSIYHALAIEHDGTFITADKRHYDKTVKYGHILLLEEWARVLTDSH